MAVVLALALLFSTATLLPYAWAQYAGALLFGPTRTVQWACYFHFLSLPKRYSPHYVGRLLGYGNLVLALLGDGPPYLLNAYVADGGYATPTDRYFIVHFGLQLLLLACLVLPAYLASEMGKAPGPVSVEMADVTVPNDEVAGEHEL